MLKALGMTPESILAQFYDFDKFRMTPGGYAMAIVPSRLRGEVARFDITDKDRQGCRC